VDNVYYNLHSHNHSQLDMSYLELIDLDIDYD